MVVAGWWPRVGAAVSSAPAVLPGARVDTCDRCRAHAPDGREKSGSSGTRTADTGRRGSASRGRPRHPARSAATHTRASIARPKARRTRGGSTDRGLAHTRPAADARVRLPFFSGDLLEDVDLQIAIGHHLLQ